MLVVYAKQPFPDRWSTALFLAGPTPRDPSVPSWRPEALAYLERRGFDGVVFVPEDASGEHRGDYIDQVEWERDGLRFADRIAFWVPRELTALPAFTTNVEFGRWAASGKAALGFPDGAPGSERTVVEVTTLGALLADARADWSTVGMALSALMASEP